MMSAASGANSARVVVAIDFGTTFSGFAYARAAEPDRVFKLYDWPGAGKAGAKAYSKTQTSLFYVPSGLHDGLFELKDWGWSALLHFTQATRSACKARPCASCSQPCDVNKNRSISNLDVLALPAGLAKKVGFFATKFKLLLACPDPNKPSLNKKPPGDITVERMVTDYLRHLSTFILSQLQLSYGKHFSMEDVQWCLTVPAIWDERAKQVMRVCAEKAGMVKGAECPTSTMASPYPLDIILEPEAASIYCQHMAKCLKLKQGDKMLVADVGGGTIDLVVQEKADDDPESMKVHEVVGSYGEVGGGTFVDTHFLRFMSEKVGCFKEFCRQNASVGISIYSWWQSIKMGFDGEGFSAELPLPKKLSEAWEKHDAEVNIGVNRIRDDDYYDEIRLEDSDIKRIFDPEVDKVLSLIEKQIVGVRVLMVVGGFSASPYLRKCIQSRFQARVEEVIIPEDPGSAICHGAVQLHMDDAVIQSRIAKKTYAIKCSRNAELGDPPALCYFNSDKEWMCKDTLCAYVKVGERIPLGHSVKKTFKPSEHKQRALLMELYSSLEKHPAYTRSGATKEGSFVVDITEGMELDKKREVEVTMCFGASLIRVTAMLLNFGKQKEQRQGLVVSFRAA